MNNNTIIFIGLDTHKSFTQVSVLKDNRGENPISYGRIDSSKSAFIKLAQKPQSQYCRYHLSEAITNLISD